MGQEDDAIRSRPGEASSPASSAPTAATILAAGLGRRLGGRPKAALQIDGTSLLERLVRTLRDAGIQDINVVIGPYQNTLLPLVKRCDAQALIHDRPDTLLVESQRLAIRSHVDRSDGHDLLVMLADLPLLTVEEVRLLLDTWRSRPANIQAQMPMVDGVRGHPLLLSWSAVEQVAATPPLMGIRDWLASHSDLVKPLVTKQRSYITDLDTPDDLVALQTLLHPQRVDWPAPWG
ncbi:molybdenum cofactor cytidylyltransferase [Polaromonas sp. OV174]|uniref:nucleotidyltransferase family protein n=1 Tax=Polaromonas sp. OV174 TaxID=1855300 RepID=UPI0008E05335|nr:NTP transferase domain-containing protein [Polaromonas sp. OV174]SFC63421.1 molybdenum cofactor cytidylyltransferase [Polaromonas sp. OV174]